MGKKARDLFIVLAVIFFIIPKNAHAYLDPGAGSMIIQYVAAILFAGLFVIKSFWKQIKMFFSNLLSKKTEGSEKDEKIDKKAPKSKKS